MAKSILDLQPQEVLSLAIAVESRNAERYETFAHIFSAYNDEASGLFSEMRDEELEHRTVLQEMYRTRYGDQVCTYDEADVDEVVEAVDVESAEHMVFNDLTRKDVLEAALRAELGAREFYTVLSASVHDEDLLALYRRLAAYEEGHVAGIKSRLNPASPAKGADGHGANS